MKISQFNSIIPLNKKLNLIYNAYSDRFIVLSNRIDYLNDIVLIKNNKSLYNKLIEAGCLIEKDRDEIELVRDLQKRVDQDTSFFNLIINPTLACNFKCWYCYESHIKDSKINADVLLRIKNLISNILDKQFNLKEFNLNFFGGEPLLCFEVVKEIISFTENICKETSKKISVGFTSNGYLLNHNRVEWLSKHSVKYLQITLDGYKEQHDKVRYPNKKSGSYDRILGNVKLLLNKDIDVILRINYTIENIYNMQYILDDLQDLDAKSKSKLDIQFHRVWQDAKGVNIDIEVDSVLTQFIDKGFIAHRHPFNNVRDSCYADKLCGALINYNGDVFRCTALNFTNHQRDGYLSEDGSIVWENNSNEIRKNIKFKNESCLKCRILPICNGGCSQKAIEYKDQDYCILQYDEKAKNNAIIDKLRNYLLFNPAPSIII